MAPCFLLLSRSISLQLLAVLIIMVASINEAATGGGVCTEGFMDLSLLVAKAARPVGSLADNTLADSNEGRWIFRHNTFNCSTAAVTEFLFGVDIRSGYGIRKYPSIEIWQLSGNVYQSPITIPIVFSPDNFTTNGLYDLYHYVLPTPLSINSNRYRIGVYQPEDDSSVVRLYNATTSSTVRIGRIRADSINDTDIKTSGSNKVDIDFQDTNNVFMIHLKTGM